MHSLWHAVSNGENESSSLSLEDIVPKIRTVLFGCPLWNISSHRNTFLIKIFLMTKMKNDYDNNSKNNKDNKWKSKLKILLFKKWQHDKIQTVELWPTVTLDTRTSGDHTTSYFSSVMCVYKCPAACLLQNHKTISIRYTPFVNDVLATFSTINPLYPVCTVVIRCCLDYNTKGIIGTLTYTEVRLTYLDALPDKASKYVVLLIQWIPLRLYDRYVSTMAFPSFILNKAPIGQRDIRVSWCPGFEQHRAQYSVHTLGVYFCLQIS